LKTDEKRSLGTSFFSGQFIFVEKWTKTFVFDAVWKLKTDEKSSLGASETFFRGEFFCRKMG